MKITSDLSSFSFPTVISSSVSLFPNLYTISLTAKVIDKDNNEKIIVFVLGIFMVYFKVEFFTAVFYQPLSQTILILRRIMNNGGDKKKEINRRVTLSNFYNYI